MPDTRIIDFPPIFYLRKEYHLKIDIFVSSISYDGRRFVSLDKGCVVLCADNGNLTNYSSFCHLFLPLLIIDQLILYYSEVCGLLLIFFFFKFDICVS